MPYNLAVESFHIKNSVADFLREKSILEEKRLLFVSELSFRGLWVTYAVHLKLTGKRVVNFLWVILEHFPLIVTAEAIEARLVIAVFLKWGVNFRAKFKAQGTTPPTIFRIGKLDASIFDDRDHKYMFHTFCHNSRVWETDTDTDGQTDRQRDI